jgi:hypothetical protein
MRKYLVGAICCGILLFGGCFEDSGTNPTDSTSPAVTIVSPTDGVTVGVGSVLIQAQATDNVGVAKVEFYDGVTKIGEDATATTGNVYDVSWTATAGSHILKAVASDAAGNMDRDSITVTVSGSGGPTYHAGLIQHSETWYPSGNPHIITADIAIEDAVNSPILTIMPGCLVQFAGDFEIFCGYEASGAIVAEGKADSLIVFTTTSNPKTPGSWKSISFFEHSTTATSLKYCTIEYGGSYANNGELFVADVAIKINYCTVRRSLSSGIVFFGDNGRAAQFTNNSVNECGGHAIEIEPGQVRTLGSGNTFTGNADNDILVRAGVITATGTWLNHGIPYLIGGDVGVDHETNNPILTIAPGCVIKFGGDYEFYCAYYFPGAIVAEGTTLLPITFTTNSNPPSAGSWKAVKVYEMATTTTSFNHCVFEYGGSEDCNLGVYNAAAKVNNCIIRYSGSDGVLGGGLEASSGHFTQFTGNTISNSAGHAVNIGPNYVRTLGTGNTYTSNTYNDILVRGGFVQTTGTWLNQGVPYNISESVEVSDEGGSSPILTIASGITIKMQANTEFVVGYWWPGGLIADGTADTIWFTSASPSPAGGDWKSVSFYEHAIDGTSKLKNCVVEYAGNDLGNIVVTNSVPEITGCTIRNSQSWGIWLEGPPNPDASELEANNTFSDNPSGNVRVPE